ncbi:MAG: hypothetical protein HYZ95_03715 [Candidatus Omnitrophica bacterium]|nr:hypothetical protein [Candidatus Omnitrophota bacterium]
MSPTVPPAAWFALVILASVGLILSYRIRDYRALRRLLPSVEQGAIRFLWITWGWVLRGTVQSTPVTIAIIPSIENDPYHLELSIPRPTPWTMKVTTEVILGGLLPWQRVEDVEGGTHALAERCWISSSDPAAARSFLNQEPIRRSVRELLDMGFQTIRWDRRYLQLRMPRYDAVTDFSPQFLQRALKGAETLR